MAIEYRCHCCAEKLTAPHYSAGKRGKCPVCSAIHLVPGSNWLPGKSLPAEIHDYLPGVEYIVPTHAANSDRTVHRRVKTPVNPLNSIQIMGSILLWLNVLHAIALAACILGLIHAIVQAMPVQVFGNPINKELSLIVLIMILSAECLIIRAGYCMRVAQDHSMAVIGAFLACIPFFNPFSIPFGVTALVLLLNPEMEKKFG
jgi:hypothetical protein